MHSTKAERTDPSQKCSIKFSVDLPQSAYVFVSDMIGKQSTLHSPTFRSSPLATCYLPTLVARKQIKHKHRKSVFPHGPKKVKPPEYVNKRSLCVLVLHSSCGVGYLVTNQPIRDSKIHDVISWAVKHIFSVIRLREERKAESPQPCRTRLLILLYNDGLSTPEWNSSGTG